MSPFAAARSSAGRRKSSKLITVHLGNGCSLAAIDHGKSVDTSMGFTPLEGLLMGTRTGDMDPAIVPWLMAMEEMTLHQVNTMMNKHSGLYGVSGVSSDMREVVEARADGHQRADVAFRMFCYRVKKYIGAYAAAMGGVDAVFFTGGIGENSPEVREWALDGLEYMGIEIDTQTQRRAHRRRGRDHHRGFAGQGPRGADQRGEDHRPRRRPGAQRHHADLGAAGDGESVVKEELRVES